MRKNKSGRSTALNTYKYENKESVNFSISVHSSIKLFRILILATGALFTPLLGDTELHFPLLSHYSRCIFREGKNKRDCFTSFQLVSPAETGSLRLILFCGYSHFNLSHYRSCKKREKEKRGIKPPPVL